MDASLFFLPGTLLTQAELSAARLDGLLFEVGDGYMPADVPEGSSARATAIASLLSPGFAASGPTAAWIHGVGDGSPARHHMQRTAQRRSRAMTGQHLVMHEALLREDEVVSLGVLTVTTPLRTMRDLALGIERYAEYERWLTGLAALMPRLIPLAEAQIRARARMPGRLAALDRLQRLGHPLARVVSLTVRRT